MKKAPTKESPMRQESSVLQLLHNLHNRGNRQRNNTAPQPSNDHQNDDHQMDDNLEIGIQDLLGLEVSSKP